MIWVFLVALFARVAFVLTLGRSDLYWPDERLYDEIATGLLNGKGFVASGYNSTPLWPAFLALLYKVFGHDFLVARLAQCVLGASTCALSQATATRLFDHRVGLCSGLLLAVYPPLVYLAGVFYMENFYAFWLAGTVYALVRLGQSPYWKSAALAGVVLGVTALSRSVALVLIPAAALVPWLATGVPRARRAGLVVVMWLAAAATIAPWTIRNWRAFQHFVPVAMGSGSTLWRGNCEFSRGDVGDRFLNPLDDFWKSRAPDDGAAERMQQLRGRLAGLDEAGADRILGEEAGRFIRENPLHCGKLYLKKWLVLHSAFSETRRQNEHVNQRNHFVAAASFYPVLALGLCGVVLFAHRWRELRVAYLVWGTFAFGLPALTACTRFRMPTDAILIMFAAAAAVRLWDKLANSPLRSRQLGLLIAAAVALRLGWCLFTANQFFWRDEMQYDAIARNLLERGFYSMDGVQPTAFRAPGQPLLIAAAYALDNNLLAARVWQALLWGVAVWLAFRVARELGAGERAALWTAGAVAVYPYYVYAAGTLFPLTLFTVALLAGTWGLLRLYNHGGWRPAVGAGVGLGVGTLAIPYLLPSALLAPLWLGRRRWRESLLATAVALVIIAPWPLRNWAVFGAPVMGTQQNLNLWYGNNPQATGSSGSNVRILPRPIGLRYRDVFRTNELAGDRILGESAQRYIREHPGHIAWLWPAKALNFFRLWPETQTHNPHTTWATKAIGALTFGPVLVLGLIGWFRGVLDRRRAAIIIIYFATFVAVSAVTISKDRFRVPLDVYLMIFAAMWIDRWLLARQTAAPCNDDCQTRTPATPRPKL